MNPNTDVNGNGSPIYDGTISHIAHSAVQKAGERDGDRFGAYPVGRIVANPADITSYYRTMYEETAAGRKEAEEEEVEEDRVARAERVSRVPKERRALGDCVRQLFTTISS